MLIGQKGLADQSLSCISQRGETNLDQTAYFVIVIEADPVPVGNGHQKKVKKDLHGGQIPKKPAGDKNDGRSN